MDPFYHCVSRRDFLRVGCFGLTFGWPAFGKLHAESPSSTGSHHKAIINIHLEGGPPQMDTFDMKPDGRAELRGEFQPIRTNVQGIGPGRRQHGVSRSMPSYRPG